MLGDERQPDGGEGAAPRERLLAELRDRLDEISSQLLGYALRRINDRDLAEELVQETFLAAVAAADSFAGRSEATTWLTAILRRKIVDHYRRAARAAQEQPAADPEEIAQPFTERGTWRSTVAKWPSDPTADLERGEFWTAFHDCRGKLPPALAAAFMVRELDGLEPAEACEALGVSRNHLAVRLYRARMLLRECLERTWFRA